MSSYSLILLFSLCFVIATSTTIDDCPKHLSRDDTLAVHGDSCYRFETKTTAIYWDARRICRMEGGDISVVKDQATNDFLQKKALELKMSKNFIWLGLRYFKYYGGFFWEDGTLPDFQTWNDNYLNKKHRCTAMHPVTGRWDQFLCETTFGSEDDVRARYVCEYPVTPKNESNKDCPFYSSKDAIIQRLDDKCYYVNLASKSVFYNHYRFCIANGGHLVQIKTKKIQDFLVKSLENMSRARNEGLWIGLNNDWKNWEDGTPVTYKNFGSRAFRKDYCPGLDYSDDRKWTGYKCRNIIFGTLPAEKYAICEFDVIKQK